MKTKNQNTKKTVLKGAAILAIGSILAKLIGAFYRIPLTNILGGQGSGIYHMVYPVYVILIVLVGGGIPTALAGLIATSKDSASNKKIFRVATVTMLAMGLVASVMVVALSGLIAKLQGNQQGVVCYLAIAPAVFFVALVSLFRGYFQGVQNLLPNSISQVIEQLSKVGLGLYLTGFLMQYGIQYGVFGALLSVSIADGMAFLCMFLFYLMTKRSLKKQNKSDKTIKNKKDTDKKQSANGDLIFNNVTTSTVAESAMDNMNNTEVAIDMDFSEFYNSYNNKFKDTSKREYVENISTKKIIKQLFKVAIPVTIGALILPISQFIDSVVVVNFLRHSGMSLKEATAQFGTINGPVSSLINMPIVFTMAIAIALMPKIAKSVFNNKNELQADNQADSKASQKLENNLNETIKKEILSSYKFGCIFGIGVSISLILFAKPIMQVLYSHGLSSLEIEQGIQMLKINGVLVAYICLLQISTAIMQGVNKSTWPTVFLSIGAVIKIAVGYIMMIWWGIYGIAVATVFFYSVALLLNVLYIKRHDLFGGERWYFLKMVSCALLSMIVGWGVNYFLQDRVGAFLQLFIDVAVLGVVYLALIFSLKQFNINDCRIVLGMDVKNDK